MQTDKLDKMFKLREEFMHAIVAKMPGYYSEWPIDPSKKESQVAVRDLILRGVEESFESLAALKNSKPHRQTEITDFNRDEFLEETVDAFNYFYTPLILLGFSSQEFFDMFLKKHEIILKRLKDGY